MNGSVVSLDVIGIRSMPSMISCPPLHGSPKKGIGRQLLRAPNDILCWHGTYRLHAVMGPLTPWMYVAYVCSREPAGITRASCLYGCEVTDRDITRTHATKLAAMQAWAVTLAI